MPLLSGCRNVLTTLPIPNVAAARDGGLPFPMKGMGLRRDDSTGGVDVAIGKLVLHYVSVSGRLPLEDMMPREKEVKPVDRGSRRMLGLRVPEDMRKALESYAECERRSVSQVALLLLEKVMVANGLCTPGGKRPPPLRD